MSAPRDHVTLLLSTADALTELLGPGDYSTSESPERMAWTVAILRHMPDDAAIFPFGKWATIQSIESQIAECAKDAASVLLADAAPKAKRGKR